MPLALRRAGDRVTVGVRVTPRASANAIAGERDGALLVRVTAPPAEGRANEAVVALLARTLDIAPSQIRIERGGSARTKLVSLPTAAEARLGRLVK